MDGNGDAEQEASILERHRRGGGPSDPTAAVTVAAIRTHICHCSEWEVLDGQVLGMRAPSAPELGLSFPCPALIPGLLVVLATLPVTPLSTLSGQHSDLFSWLPRGAVCLSD